jgi:regulatory protein YycI of two-component signal transduction system YycFG
MIIAFILISILLTLIIFEIYKSNKNDRFDKYSLHQKLMASTLKDPKDGPFYF